MSSLAEIAEGVRSGRLDPVLLVEQALQRAEDSKQLNAVVHLDADGARKAAANHTRAGALAGVPVLVKEIIEVEGLPYRCGSASMDEIAQRDAEVVARLRAAGAIVIGLSHTHEFAYGCTGTSNRVGPCRNPHDPTRMTGGSSSGAGAAVAAGIVPLAIGTDTAGSVRIPAALCGVVGFKPAYGTLPIDGVFPLALSLDHVGVLTTTVADAAYAIAALTGTTEAVQPSATRLGVVVNEEYLDYTPEVGAAWSTAISRLSTIDVRLPDWAESFQTAADLQGPEAAANHAGRNTDLYQPDVQERLREAAAVPITRYDAARTKATEITAAMSDLLDQVDAVITPTVLTTAPPIDAVDDPAGSLAVRAQLLKNTRLANLTRHPAITIPLPTPGLPIGLQVIAKDNNQALAAADLISRRLEV
ncbi:aspartyl-tRNA(Asn)/glutamyl-tRNA(Gln) amidotransferase subunit A [Kribbella steppae]|uniref:Aspartyl-tRNA(Asn)/glutamyl-tRNA(Gln) amidotransferase subunit A n=1 Tax=Kribbella steppae TaxID=2512223 RepID=A0A4R2HXW3_9ACTN|nr:amidase [Kribbella steppae]TCO36066.1 aspartyl-tRNA(Asn)/glutamyl-tRNA(Gln) amidotransferase subunit A [Kribbella steppae]